MRNGRRQGGFSLLEVLVAFAIFSAGLGIIFQVYSVGSRAAAAGADYAAAALVARARLAEAGILDPRNSAEYRARKTAGTTGLCASVPWRTLRRTLPRNPAWYSARLW